MSGVWRLLHRAQNLRGRLAWRARPLWLSSLIVVLAACATDDVVDETRFRGAAFGTAWTAVLPDALDIESANRWQVAFENEIERLDRLFSRWRDDSTLSRFNASDSIDYVAAPRELLDLLDVAHGVNRASDGAYDVTLGEVFALYGFGAGDNDARTVPENAALEAAIARATPSGLVRDGDRLRKRDARLQLDLDSIAKGHAVDRLGELLEAAGLADYLVEIGGEVRTRGAAAGSAAWLVGLELPDGSAEEGLALHDAHLATSGSYRNWREIDGERVSHVIDGRDGSTLAHDLVSVSVIAASTALADAWSTALLVVGFDAARALGRTHGLEIQLIRRAGEAFEVWRSDGFAERIVQAGAAPDAAG